MKIVLSHPTGNANVRGVATSMASAKVLMRFYTSIVTNPGILSLLPRNKISEELSRRSYDFSLHTFINTYPWYELGRLISLKAGFENLLQPEVGRFCIDSVYQALDKKVASELRAETERGATAIYAYEDGALESFKMAKNLGLTCIYDLPIAYWETSRKLLQEEAERLPQWRETLGGGIMDSEAKLRRKEEELEMADIVVGPGSFVLDSLPEWAKNKSKICSPFGSPAVTFPKLHASKDKKRKLRVLFIGSMGQRKGLGDLFSALKMINKNEIELIVLGALLDSMDFYRSEYSDFTYEPGRSHQEVLKLMSTCDVFCLPSIVEGRALVMQEAMSQGLPLIITANTGGADLIEEGETGFLVPVRSPEVIAEKLEWFLDNRDQLPLMSKKARRTAATYTWKNYGDKIVKEVKDITLNTKQVYP